MSPARNQSSLRSSKSWPTAIGGCSAAPKPTAPNAHVTPLDTASVFPCRHPLKKWGLRETRGGSLRRLIQSLAAQAVVEIGPSWQHLANRFPEISPEGFLARSEEACTLAFSEIDRWALGRAAEASAKEDCGVFISHIGADSKIAIELQRLLIQALGREVPVFVSSDDHSIITGEEWHAAIVQKIKVSRVTIVLLSAASVKRPWINFESGVAIGSNRALIPVLIRGFSADGLYGHPLSQYHARRLYDRTEAEAALRDIALALELPTLASRDKSIAAVIEAASVPAVAQSLSDSALDLAQYFCEVSESGLENEPYLSIEEYAAVRDLSLLDIAEAARELDELGWVRRHESVNSTIGIVGLTPLPLLFFEMDPVIKGWNPGSDASRVVGLCRERNDQADGLNLREIGEGLGWGVRRLNVAVQWAERERWVEMDRTCGTVPYVANWLRLTGKGRQVGSGRP